MFFSDQNQNFDYDTSFNIIGIKIFNEIKKAYNIDEIIQFLENSVLKMILVL